MGTDYPVASALIVVFGIAIVYYLVDITAIWRWMREHPWHARKGKVE